jgi:hypothetical protein
MDGPLEEIRAASEDYTAAQQQLADARRRLQAALQAAYAAGLRTDLIHQAAALPTSTLYRLLGGVRR